MYVRVRCVAILASVYVPLPELLGPDVAHDPIERADGLGR